MTRTGTRAARLAALVVALCAAATSMAPAGALTRPGDAGPATATTSTTATTTRLAGKAVHQVTATLVAVNPGVVRPGDDVTVVVDVKNGTDHVVAAPLATVTLDRFRDTTRSDVAQWSSRRSSDDLGSVVGTQSVPSLDAGATKRMTVTVDAGALRLGTGADVWGPRGLAVTITDGTSPTASGAKRLAVIRTFLLWYPVGDGSPEKVAVRDVRLGVAVPITGPAVTTADAAAAASSLATATAPGSRLADVVAATQNTPKVSWVADPALVASASHATDAQARAWARTVCSAADGRTVYALPPMDPDVAAYAHAGHKVPGGHGSLTTADCTGDTEPSSATGATTATPSPTATPTKGSTGGSTSTPVATGTDLATVWQKGLAWPAEAVPDATTLATAVSSGRSTVIVEPGATGPLSATDGLTTPGVVSNIETSSGTAHLLVADPEISSAASTPTTENLQLLLATTAVVSREDEIGSTDDASLLAAMPRDWDPDAVAWESQLDALTAAPWVTLTPVDQLARTDASSVARRAPADERTTSTELSPDSVDALTDERSAVTRFAAIGTDPAAITDSVRAGLLSPASVAFRTSTTARSQQVTDALAASRTLRGSVGVVSGSTFNLISSSGGLPVTVRNALDQDVTVRIVLQSDDPKLVVEGSPTVVVPSGRDRTVRVAVRAVGNGDVRVTVQLRSTAGSTVAVGEPFDVRVRAGWEAIGTWVVLVLLGVAFVAGIWRTVRRGRSSARTTRQESPEAETAGTDTSELPAGTDPGAAAPRPPESEEEPSPRDTPDDPTS